MLMRFYVDARKGGLTVWDCAIVFFWVALSVFLISRPWAGFPLNGNNNQLEVKVNGNCVYKCPVTTDMEKTFTGYKGYTCTVKVKDGRARVLRADCPDQLCRSMGWITASNSIICLPARIMISITGPAASNKLDGVTR